MMKEKIFHEKEEFVNELKKTKKRFGIRHPHIMEILDYSSITKKDNVERCHKVRLFYP